jgi:hypothetical protein
MSVLTAIVFAALQAQPPADSQQTAQLPPSPIAKLVVTPGKPVMSAQDTLQLSAQALDAGGRPVDNVRYRFVASRGARFEGSVDSTGLVRSGSTGTSRLRWRRMRRGKQVFSQPLRCGTAIRATTSGSRGRSR